MLLPKEKIRLLSMVDVLEPLSEEELEEFGRRVPDTHVEQGQIFFTPGDRSEAPTSRCPSARLVCPSRSHVAGAR